MTYEIMIEYIRFGTSCILDRFYETDMTLKEAFDKISELSEEETCIQTEIYHSDSDEEIWRWVDDSGIELAEALKHINV